MTVILQEISKGRQNVFVQKIIQGTNHLIRLVLNSDSYEAQCYSRVYVFDKATNNWNILYKNFNHSIPSGLVYRINNNQSPDCLLRYFTDEIKHLQKIASKLLQDKF
ncbi:MAG TPA: hypothetical protein PLP75_01530 [Burkholderiales bacterium]|nr:hypothetical protein [Burkholderiales bacterium]